MQVSSGAGQGTEGGQLKCFDNRSVGLVRRDSESCGLKSSFSLGKERDKQRREMNLSKNKCSKWKRYKFRMEKQGTGWSSMQRVLVGVPHAPGGIEELVDDAGLGDMAEIGNKNQPDRCQAFFSWRCGLVEGQRRLVSQCFELARVLDGQGVGWRPDFSERLLQIVLSLD